MKKFKNILGVIISVSMFLSIITPTGVVSASDNNAVFTETDEIVGISNAEELKEAIANASTDSAIATKIALTSDISFGEAGNVYLNIEGTTGEWKYIEIDGNGHSFILTKTRQIYPETGGGNKGLVVVRYADVTFRDITIDANYGGDGIATTGYANPLCVLGGKVTLDDGAILTKGGAFGSSEGTALGLMGGATFEMNTGSKITEALCNGDSATSSTIYLSGADNRFIMNGGEISGNTSGKSGLFYAKSGSYTGNEIILNSGSIINNTYKGAVYTEAESNYATYKGNQPKAIRLDGDATFNLEISGDMVIEESIFLDKSHKRINVTSELKNPIQIDEYWVPTIVAVGKDYTLTAKDAAKFVFSGGTKKVYLDPAENAIKSLNINLPIPSGGIAPSSDAEWDASTGSGLLTKIENMTAGFREDYLKDGENEIYIKGKAPESGIAFQIITALYRDDVVEDVKISEKYSYDGRENIDISEILDLSGYNLAGMSAQVYLWDDISTMRPVAYAVAPQLVAFEFVLDENAKTSAGVYDEQDRLVKTLWSVAEYEAGVHTGTWDGTDDNGNIVNDGNYTVKVASNNVEYEKIIPVIGNSTECTDWNTVVGGYCSIFDMAYDEVSGKIFYCSDHMEGDNGLMYLNSDDLSRKGGTLLSHNKTATHVTTDGERVYWATAELSMYTKPSENKYARGVRSFVHATDMIGNAYKFTAVSQPVSSKWNEGLSSANFPYCINYVLRKGYDYDNTDAVNYPLSAGAEFVLEYDENNQYNRIGGIEVQKNGNYLFTAYRDLGKVFVNDKLTGERVYTLDISEPSAMAKSSASDVYIYIAYRNENGKFNVGKFAVSGNGGLSKQADVLTELDTVVAIAVNPANDKLAVAEGGNTNKLSVYEASSGLKLLEYGSGESYASDTTVKDDKFMFRDRVFMYNDLYEHSFIEFDSDNTLLIGDSGNTRVLKLDVSGEQAEIVDRILYQRCNYSTWCVENEPTVVLADYKEYSIDYDKLEEYISTRADKNDYSGFEDVWKVKRNYLEYMEECVPDFSSSLEGWFFRATKLSSGYLYFGMNITDGMFMYKQSPDGIITPTGIDITGKDLHADGSLWWREASGNKVIYYKSELQSFDEDNNPVYKAAVKVAEIDYTNNETSPRQSEKLINITDSNKLVILNAPGPLKSESVLKNEGKTEDVYDTSTGKVRMHLGAVNLNENTEEIQWEASPGTLRRYNGFFPEDGYFEMGGETLYTARNAITYKNNIIFHYRGEGHSQAQASRLYHFTDDGLFVGMFGKSMKEYGGEFLRSPDATSGTKSREGLQSDVVPVNSFCTTITGAIDNPDVAYIYQNTEFYATGVHITRVSGLESINTQSVPIIFNNEMVKGIKYTVFGSDDLNSATQVDCGITDNFNIPAIKDETEAKRSVRFEGYFRTSSSETYTFAVKTDGMAALYIDGRTVIEGTGDMTSAISLEDNCLCKFILEICPTEEGTLSYLDVGYLKNGVFTGLDHSVLSTFRPRENENGKINLLEGIKYGARENGIIGKYGWSFENLCAADDTYSNFKIEANDWTYRRNETPDINMVFTVQNFSDGNDEMRLERNLGEMNSDSWKVEMDVRWQKHFAAWQKNFVPAEGRENKGRNGFAGNLIELLDVNGKTIASFYIYGARAESNNMNPGEDASLFYVKVNDEEYFTTPKSAYLKNLYSWSWTTYDDIRKFENVPFNLPKTLSFEPDGDKIKVKYGNVEAISVELCDIEADITKPATVRFASCNDYGSSNTSFVGKGRAFSTNITRFELTK